MSKNPVFVFARPLACAVVVALTACSGTLPSGDTRATDTGTTLPAPDAQGRRVLAFFTPETAGQGGELSAAPVAGGYYRVLIAQNQGANGQPTWRVQDFYQDTRTPQSSEFTLKREADLHSWAPTSVDGLMVWYSPKGHKESDAMFRDGVISGNAHTYTESGKTYCSRVYVNGELHGLTQMFHPATGRELARLNYRNDEPEMSTLQAFTDAGQRIRNTKQAVQRYDELDQLCN